MMHKGIGLIIGNRNRDKFFIQIKDNEYPIKKWIGAFSFWGGGIEASDISELEALRREIIEEIEPADFILNHEWKRIDSFIVESEPAFHFTLYEMLIEDHEFDEFNHVSINEGFGTFAFHTDLLEREWVWGLKSVFQKYMNDY